MARTIHLSLSVRGALRNGWWRTGVDGSLVGYCKHDDGRRMTADEVFNVLCDALANGQEELPLGACDNFDPKRGCLGHDTVDEDGD